MCYWSTSIIYLTLKGLNDAHCKLFCHRCDPAAIILVACEDFYLFYTISFVLKWHFKYHFRSGNHSQRSSPIACQLNSLLIRIQRYLLPIFLVKYMLYKHTHMCVYKLQEVLPSTSFLVHLIVSNVYQMSVTWKNQATLTVYLSAPY